MGKHLIKGIDLMRMRQVALSVWKAIETPGQQPVFWFTFACWINALQTQAVHSSSQFVSETKSFKFFLNSCESSVPELHEKLVLLLMKRVTSRRSWARVQKLVCFVSVACEHPIDQRHSPIHQHFHAFRFSSSFATFCFRSSTVYFHCNVSIISPLIASHAWAWRSTEDVSLKDGLKMSLMSPLYLLLL